MTPPRTIFKGRMIFAHCTHCDTKTIQYERPAANPFEQGSCLQCIADGGTCCSLSPWNRWRSS